MKAFSVVSLMCRLMWGSPMGYQVNDRWRMDLVADVLHDGRWFEILTAHDMRRRVLFVTGLLLISGGAAFIGAVPTRVYGHDIFFLLDNGWRVLNGQRPHVDYVSPWGPLTFLITGLGLLMSSHMVDGIGYASAVAALIIGLWSYVLGRDRLTDSIRILLSLFLAALVASPYPLGVSPFLTSHAMVYNRYGYALLALILLERLAPPRRSVGATEWVGGVSTGVALALMLFLKASYFLIGIGLIGISLLFYRLTRRHVMAFVLGFMVISFCMLLYLHFDLGAMFRDLRMAAGARTESLSARTIVLNILHHASAILAVILLVFVASYSMNSGSGRWQGLRFLVLGVVLFAADICALSSNAQDSALPIIAVFAVLVINEIVMHQRTVPASEARATRGYCVATIAVGALLFVPQFASDLVGLAYGGWEKARPPQTGAFVHFTSPNLKPLVLYAGGHFEWWRIISKSNGPNFTMYINDGVALLQQVSTANETILTMDMTNPFPYALGRRPPRGGIAAVAYNYTVSDKHHPSDAMYFGDADIVMVPKRPAQIDWFYVGYYKIYEAGLKERFRVAAESDSWYLYKRK